MVVYKITSKLNNKCYIGITNDFNRRMREHKTLHSKNSLIEQAIQLDGVDNFIYEIIEKERLSCVFDGEIALFQPSGRSGNAGDV